MEACNNGNDDAPTWEDVTQAVNSGSKFFFSNTTKTAAEWGFNFRIKVRRHADGGCNRILFVESKGGKRCEDQKSEPGGNGRNAR